MRKENSELSSANQSLASRNWELEAELAELRQKLAAYEVIKDSSNSSKPPSPGRVVKQAVVAKKVANPQEASRTQRA
ncbi:MAG: hypothetical protein R3B93_15935 [Bacteroidia bacterium]